VLPRCMRRLTVPALALPFALLLSAMALPGGAQTLPGDVDGDGSVSADDLSSLETEIFDGDGDDVLDVEGGDFAGTAGADANADGLVNGADFPRVVGLQPGLTPVIRTPTPTLPPPTPSATATPTPTQPSTPSTPTPTSPSTACAPRAVGPGTVNGALEAGDCTTRGNGNRLTDIYSVAANPGQAIRIQLQATGFTPRLIVTDPGSYFGSARAGSSIEFLVTTNRRYTFEVTSVAPGSMVGSYAVTISVRNCAAPVPVTPTTRGTSRSGSITASDCPDPAVPDDPADRYSFTARAGAAYSVHMKTPDFDERDHPDPFLIVYGPRLVPSDFTGFKLAEDDDSGATLGDPENDLDDDSDDALLFFYAIEAGVVTVVASRGEGSYSIVFTELPCTVKPVVVPGDPVTVEGVLTGTSCPAPFPLPASGRDPNNRADVWTLTAGAGDVIAASLSSFDFDSQLYLLDPQMRLVASDDDGSENGFPDAQLAYTVIQGGTYTVVAASNDPSITLEDSTGTYSLTLQRCPSTPLSLDTLTADSFVLADCHGTGGALVNSYRFDGVAGQFVSATMSSDSSSDIDPVLKLTDPSGTSLQNNDDPFLVGVTLNSRISWVLPQTSTYFLTATSSQDAGSVEGGYALLVERCRTTPVGTGRVTGEFRANDCQLASDGDIPGAKLNVFTLPTGSNQVVSALLADGTCALVSTPDGLSGPGPECSVDFLNMPAAQAGVTAIVVAAPDGEFLGQHSFELRSCPISGVPGYASSFSGFITSGDCRDASGLSVDFYLVRAPRSLVTFNGGYGGQISTGFADSSLLLDSLGAFALSDGFGENTEDLLSIGTDLGFAVLVRPAQPDTAGSYSLIIAPALFYQ
jgi:hypothetical protein